MEKEMTVAFPKTFDTTPRETDRKKCVGIYNDCVCGCGEVPVGATCRPCDLFAGATFMSVAAYRNYVAGNVEEPDAFTPVEVTYDAWTTTTGIDVVTWEIQVTNTYSIQQCDTDVHTYVRVA